MHKKTKTPATPKRAGLDLRIVGVVVIMLIGFSSLATLIAQQADRLTRLELDNTLQQAMLTRIQVETSDNTTKLAKLCTHFKTGCTEYYVGKR